MISISTTNAIVLFLAFAGLVAGFGRILVSQFETRMNDRFLAVTKALADESARLRDLTNRVDQLHHALPLEYVRREDWTRFSALIDAKLDRVAELVHSSLARNYRS